MAVNAPAGRQGAQTLAGMDLPPSELAMSF